MFWFVILIFQNFGEGCNEILLDLFKRFNNNKTSEIIIIKIFWFEEIHLIW